MEELGEFSTQCTHQTPDNVDEDEEYRECDESRGLPRCTIPKVDVVNGTGHTQPHAHCGQGRQQ